MSVPLIVKLKIIKFIILYIIYNVQFLLYIKSCLGVFQSMINRRNIMSKPDKAVALNEFPEELTKSTSTDETSFVAADYEKEVNTAVNDMKLDDDGKWLVPDGMTPETQFAVNAERRRRDTQNSYTKSQQSLKVEESRTRALTEQLEVNIRPNLTVEQAEELEDLKESNPDKWREKLNEYDAAAYGEHEKAMEDINSIATQTAEESRRDIVLTQFFKDNPELDLNDYVFENDLPPRITGKLSNGEISFEGFLEEAKEYLTKEKRIAIADPGKEEPNLNKSGGASKATDEAVNADSASTYEKEIF